MAFYDPMIFELHVLLVDGDLNSLYETTLLLESNLYKVTAVDEVSAASSVLSKGKVGFDVVMIDINSFNIQGYKLLHQAVSMGLPVILMSNNANATLVKCAIEDGAFLFMEKPTTVGELKYLWQHVLREKVRKKRPIIITDDHNQNEHYVLGDQGNLKNCSNSVNEYVATKKASMERSKSVNSENGLSDPSMKHKTTCTEWTPELHQKFMAAVSHLGEGRCFPKDILEVMNVPGLTRMQVASHLQKCRYGWQPPHERNGRRLTRGTRSSDHPHRSKIKRYGMVPRVNQSCPPPSPSQIDQNNEQAPIATSATNIENSTFFNNTNNIVEQGALTTASHVANNTNMNMMNENLSENDVVGQMMGEMLQPYDPTDQTTFDQAASFWSWWVGEFAREPEI